MTEPAGTPAYGQGVKPTNPREFDLSMPVGEALRRGLVQRVHPRWSCGSHSPETDVPCHLEPGHEGAHFGRDGRYSSVGWDNLDV